MKYEEIEGVQYEESLCSTRTVTFAVPWEDVQYQQGYVVRPLFILHTDPHLVLHIVYTW